MGLQGAGGEDAAMKAVLFGVGVAALEKVGLEKIFKGANKRVITRALAAGVAESASEWGEEPLAASDDTGGSARRDRAEEHYNDRLDRRRQDRNRAPDVRPRRGANDEG